VRLTAAEQTPLELVRLPQAGEPLQPEQMVTLSAAPEAVVVLAD
jgi:hypothetical protein